MTGWLTATLAALTHLFTGLGHADLRVPAGEHTSRSAHRVPLGQPWTRLAGCESGGRWDLNSGNGYYGGLQFTVGTWAAFGGNAFAAFPSEASRRDQIIVARRVQRVQGWAAWPYCSLEEGLR